MANQSAERFRLLSPADLASLPDPTWLIKGILPTNSLCVLYGEPGCGKTFIALSMALSISAGHNWCGKPTKAGSVLYIAAEGLVGFKLRVPAYERKHDIDVQQIRYLATGFNLLEEQEIESVVQSLKAANFVPDLIVVDTLARSMVGGDENSAQEMGIAIANADALRLPYLATVLLIHHTVKSGKWERGSGALRGAADVMIECSRAALTGLVSLKCDKMKDAEPFHNAILGLEVSLRWRPPCGVDGSVENCPYGQ